MYIQTSIALQVATLNLGLIKRNTSKHYPQGEEHARYF